MQSQQEQFWKKAMDLGEWLQAAVPRGRDSSQCFSDSKAKPKLSSPLGLSHFKFNKGIASPTQLTVKPLSAKTSGASLHSWVLQYPKPQTLIHKTLGTLVCAVCCCGTSQHKHEEWCMCGGYIKRCLCGVSWPLRGGEGESTDLIFLLVSSLYSIGSMPLPEGKEELPSTVRAQLGCEASTKAAWIGAWK